MPYTENIEFWGIKEIIADARKCLENKIYLGALNLCLTIPDIMGKLAYPEEKVGSRYIKWFDENLGQYEQSPDDKETGSPMPYLSGKFCHDLRNAILHSGSNDELKHSVKSDTEAIEIDDKYYQLDDFCFYISPDDNPMEFGTDFSSYETSSQNKEPHNFKMAIDIKNLCLKIILVAEGVLKQDMPDTSPVKIKVIRKNNSTFDGKINLGKAINKLRERYTDLKAYYDLSKKIYQVDVSKDKAFQKSFNHFYRIRIPKNNRDSYKEFYELFEISKRKSNVSFESIYSGLYKITGRTEVSFSSKILHSINDNQPIYDSKVAEAVEKISGLKLHKYQGTDKNKKYENGLTLYSRLSNWYNNFINSSTAKEVNDAFDINFPEFKDISAVKKIDFILWMQE